MTEQVRVLLVIDSLGVGGAEALLPTFLRHIDRRRFDVRVLTLSIVGTNHIQADVRDSCGSLTQWPGRRLRNLGRIRELANAIEAQDADLVHTHLLYSNVQASIAARLTGRPVVATLHNVHQHNPRFKRMVEARALRATRARALAVSHEVSRSYRGPLRLSAHQLTVVPNAIDLNRFASLSSEAIQRTRRDALAGAAGPLLVGVGRVVPQKGFAILARAAATVHERYPQARFVIAGRAADGWQAVEHEINRCGMAGVFRLLGQRDDVPQLLAAADVYVSPSLSEGAPVTLLEAMAAGTPVVATRVGGVPEIINDGENGLLVPAGDDGALARALARLLDDHALAGRLADRGRETVRSYGADVWAARIEQEYLRALAHRGRAPIGQAAR